MTDESEREDEFVGTAPGEWKEMNSTAEELFPDVGGDDSHGDGAEFFVYECSENDGMKTLVETYKDRPVYEDLDCETLVGIIGWGGRWPEEVSVAPPSGGDGQ